MFEHCDLEDLAAMFGENPAPEDVRRTVLRLLRGQPLGPVHPLPDRFAYEPLFHRFEEYARRADNLPLQERTRFYRTLRLLGRGARELAGDGRKGAARLGVYEALLARSWVLRFENPQEMCRLAQAAVDVAGRLSLKTHGAQRVADLRARAWGDFANALRVADRLNEAKLAFGQAVAFSVRGTGDPLLKARILELEASYFGTLRQFASAQNRLDLVPEMYRQAGKPHLAGRTLLARAVYVAYSGDPEAALRFNREGLALVDREREPDLVGTALHNQLSLLIDLGRFPEAQRFLFDSRARLQSCGRISRLKLRGLEGQLSYGQENWTSAEIAFREVKEGFKKEKLRFAYALMCLYLAMALLRQGKADEAEKEVLAASKVFFSLRIHREIFGSVLLLKEAAEMRRLTVLILEAEVRNIRQAEMKYGAVQTENQAP